MDCEIKLSKFQDIANNIIKIEHIYEDRILKLQYKSDPEQRKIMNIISYLNKTDWKNFKFNQYSVKKNENDYTIILNYVAPKTAFSK